MRIRATLTAIAAAFALTAAAASPAAADDKVPPFAPSGAAPIAVLVPEAQTGPEGVQTGVIGKPGGMTVNTPSNCANFYALCGYENASYNTQDEWETTYSTVPACYNAAYNNMWSSAWNNSGRTVRLYLNSNCSGNYQLIYHNSGCSYFILACGSNGTYENAISSFRFM